VPRPLTLWLVGAVLTTVLAGCDGGQEARSGYALCVKGVSRTEQGVLRVCAQLNADTLAAFVAALRPEDQQVLLTSGGGPAVEAMAFADLVAERGLTIRVRQFCTSACATYVLPAARAVVVEPQTVVAFHHTAAFAIDVFNDRAGAALTAPSRNAAEQERSFFVRHGRPPDLSWRIASAVEPYCVGIERTQNDAIGRIEYRNAWYVPDATALKEIVGDKVSGWWPTSSAEIAAILRPTLGDPDANVAFGALPPAPADTAAFARALPTCPATQ